MTPAMCLWLACTAPSAAQAHPTPRLRLDAAATSLHASVAKPSVRLHAFYDRPAKVELAAAIAFDAADTIQTCHNLAAGGHEYNTALPQSCGGIAAALAGEVAAQELVAYALHRLHWHKLERVARFYTIEQNAQGLAFSIREPYAHRRVR